MFGAVDELLASCVVIQFWVFVFKCQLVCKFAIVERNLNWFDAFIHVLYITQVSPINNRVIFIRSDYEYSVNVPIKIPEIHHQERESR